MKNIISKVLPNGLGEEVGIEVGDILLTINGEEIKDILDYKFLMADEYINIEIQKTDGEIWEIEIEKDYEEGFKIILFTRKLCNLN